MLKSGEKLRKLLMLLATWGLLLAFFIAYNRYFVIEQREFLKEDGFRALTTLSGELNAQVQKAQKSTEALIKLAAPDHKQEPLQRETTLKEFLRLYIPDAAISPEALQDIKRCSPTSPENAGSPPIKITPGHEPFTILISCYKDNPNHTRGLGALIDLYTVNLVKGVRDAFEKQSRFDDVLVADSSGSVIFQKSITGADPALLKSSTKPRITNLKPLLTSSATAEPKKQDNEPAGKKSDPKKVSDRETAVPAGNPANMAGKTQGLDSGSDRDDQYGSKASGGIPGLIGASAFTEVTAAGQTYEMFSRPTPIQLPFGETWDLVVVGLWDAKQFDGRSREIPYSTLIWAALIVIAVVSLSWPFLKLRYMSNTERFTAIDGWYLVLALFLAATSIMFMLLNASYIAHEQDKSDQSMQKLASLIKSNLELEMVRAVVQLDKFPEYSSWKKQALQPNFFLNGNASGLSYPYPYFDSAFWTDGDGVQGYKVDVRSAPTPNINVGFRPYFTRALSANEHSVEDHYLEPILTKATDEFEVDLAGRFPYDASIKVEALSLRPMSLVDPVLPPSYRFAVIDIDCNVLFHSDSYRNMRENFCEDSKDKDELRPWLFSGVDTPLDISYEGNTERAYLTSLESSPESPRFALESKISDSSNTQAFLLVFREPDIVLTLNLAVVLVCSVLMGAYFVMLVALALLYHLVRGSLGLVYMPPFLWPQRKHAGAYLQIFASNMLILVLFWWLHPRLYEAPLLALTVAVAVMSILLALSKLASPGWGPLILAALVAVTILVSWLAIPSRPENDPLDWEYVWRLLGAACLIAVLLADKVSAWLASTRIAAVVVSMTFSWVRRASGWLTWVRYFAEKHFSEAYVLAALSVIIAAGLVPCIGFFKYSYDAITELALKRDEIDVSERLIHRRDRILEYYKVLHSPKTAEGPVADQRISARWDRYDSDTLPREYWDRYNSAILPRLVQPFFDVPKEDSPLVDDPCKDFDKPQSGEKHGEVITRDDLNDRIERVIAQATLRLPTNPIGAEMSKLGVASTNDAEKTWEHCWKELSPTSFQLFWRGTSRWPGGTVKATYPDWQGLAGGQRFFLVLLWLGLGFWLAIVLKEIFLTYLEDAAPFETVDVREVADSQQNWLVIERPESGRELLKEVTDLPRGNRIDLRIELKKMVEDKSYRPSLEGEGNLLILDHFDFNMKDRNYNQARLDLLEDLLCKLDLNLGIISTIDPLYFLTDDATEALADGKDSALTRRLLLDRWATALSKFKKLYSEKLLQNEFTEVSDANRMDSYYHLLWTGLSPTERLVLYQLARDGWANPKNLVAIQQLTNKQLVRRNPMYQIIEESFRRFVLSPEHAEEIAQWEALEQQSTWHAMKFVVMAIGIGFASWLLYTQAAFSQTVVGYVAAIATLLTAAGSLFGRSGRSMSAKAEGE